MACRIAKAGYFGGDPLKVMESPINAVLTVFEYEAFDVDYQNAVYELNKEAQ